MKYWKDGGFYLEQDDAGSRYEITDEEWQRLLDAQSIGKEIYTKEDGSPDVRDYIPNRIEEIQWQIENLKRNLADTDYQAIKYAEGEISEEDYLPIKEKRRAWREEINRLEKEN